MPTISDAQLRQSNASAAAKARRAAPRKKTETYRSRRYSGSDAERAFIAEAERRARAELAREAGIPADPPDWRDLCAEAPGVTTPTL